MTYLALKNLQLRKLRSAISILAVGVGIMTLVVLRGLTEGTIGEVAQRMSTVKADLLVWDKSHSTLVHRAMSSGYAEKIAPLPGVARVIPVLNDSITLGGQAQTIYAVPAKDFDIFASQDRLVEGQLFRPGEMELVIDSVLARIAKLRVGDTVDHRDGQYTIVGIVREGVVGRVFMSYETAVRLWQNGENRATMLMVKVDKPSNVAAVTTGIRRLGLIVVDKGSYYDVIAHDAYYLKAFIVSITIVTLFVSFLTILLTMFTIVQEQTREVGILKSLGATKAAIVRLVVTQSLIICTAGVLLGFVLSFCGKMAIYAAAPLLTVSLRPDILAAAVGVGLVGGVLGALYPALHAAGLDPVETLSYE